MVHMASTSCCKWAGTPNCWRCAQSLSDNIMSKRLWNQQNKNRDIHLQILLVQLKCEIIGYGPKWFYFP